MAETELTAAQAAALNGTTDSDTGFKYHSPADAEYYTEGQRQRQRLLAIAKALGNKFRVYKDGATTYGVRPGRLEDGEVTRVYAGSAGNVLTTGSTNYIYLYSDAGTLTLATNITGLPDQADTPHLPLATIDVGETDYSYADITDLRQQTTFRLGSKATAADLNSLVGGSAPNLAITFGQETDDTIAVTLQARDLQGVALAERFLVRVWIATSDYGAPDATDNTVSVTTGTVHTIEAADAAYTVVSDANGTVVLNVTVSGSATRCVLAEIDGRVHSSGTITWTA